MSQFLNKMDYDDVPFSNEGDPSPNFFDFSESADITMLLASAYFYRTDANTNIEITLTEGIDISPGTIYRSPDTLLPISSFNSTQTTTEIIFPDSNSANILDDLDLMHDVRIQYKLTKSDDTNFTNCRELRTILVKDDESTIYHSGISSHNQPDTGQHDNIFIKGPISHLTDDKVKIKFNLIQDTTNSDNSDTKLTIFRITWTIFGIKQG